MEPPCEGSLHLNINNCHLRHLGTTNAVGTQPSLAHLPTSGAGGREGGRERERKREREREREVQRRPLERIARVTLRNSEQEGGCREREATVTARPSSW